MFKNRLFNVWIAVAFVLVISLTGFSLSAAAGSEGAGPKKDLVGTWRVTVTPYDCESDAEHPSFQSMLSFAEGGILTETSASPAFQPGQRSPGHGIWTAIGNHKYNSLLEAYILFTTDPNPPVPGFQRGLQRLTQAVEVNGNQLTTDGSVEFFDAEGNLVLSACAKAVGERME